MNITKLFKDDYIQKVAPDFSGAKVITILKSGKSVESQFMLLTRKVEN